MAAPSKADFPLQDIIQWDIPNWSQLVDYWLPLLDSLPRNSKVLAIGERDGGLSLWLALMGFNVVCTDIKDISSQTCPLHKKYKVEDKITYKVLDIVNDNPEPETYDVVIAKSVIGGLKAIRGKPRSRSTDVQLKAIENIHCMLKTGGYFFSAENMRGNWLMQWVRKKRKGKKIGWRHIGYNELGMLFAPFPLVQIKTFGILPTFFSRKALNRLMYFLNKYVFPFLPAGSSYIAFITARKQ